MQGAILDFQVLCLKVWIMPSCLFHTKPGKVTCAVAKLIVHEKDINIS